VKVCLISSLAGRGRVRGLPQRRAADWAKAANALCERLDQRVASISPPRRRLVRESDAISVRADEIARDLDAESCAFPLSV
jgi:hypothetical protein